MVLKKPTNTTVLFPCSALDSTYLVLDAPVTPLLTCSLVACRLLQVGHVGHASSNREG